MTHRPNQQTSIVLQMHGARLRPYQFYRQLQTTTKKMSVSPIRSYASVTQQNGAAMKAADNQTSTPIRQAQHNPASTKPQSIATGPPSPSQPHQRRSPSPSHIPRTSAPESEVYVLTLQTSKKLHQDMTSLRTRYFPPKLNHLDAHLTLFHALPGSKLESNILPRLKEVAASTSPFQLLAATPFKLRKGIAIGVPKGSGGDAAKAVHKSLRQSWLDFLSAQDAGGFASHYTIMNKVDRQQDVDNAFAELMEGWQPIGGTVSGFSLFRYERGRWKWQQDFEFDNQLDSRLG